ncbi:MAG: IS1595 family transposase [Alphaproteobacteria bacterium]
MAKRKSFTLNDFLRRFPTDEACLNHLMRLRYGETIECPKCLKTGRFVRIKAELAYSCPWCGHHIHPMQGTPFKRTHVPLHKWFYAIYLFTTTRHGVPAKELERQLGVSYPTAFRMAHEIRKYMAKIDGDDPLKGHVEVDEAYLGGVRRGQGRGPKGKTVVFGMLERSGDVMTKVVPSAERDVLVPHIRENICDGSTISSDEHGSYNGLTRMGFKHGVVKHSAKEWVHGAFHTNSLEGFWSQLKRSIRGTHVHVSAKHLAKYLGEFEFRYNLRHSPETMFLKLVMSF